MTDVYFCGDNYHAELTPDGWVITTLWDLEEYPVAPEDADRLSFALTAAVDQVCVRFIPQTADDAGEAGQ